jgi:hypothetical protein
MLSTLLWRNVRNACVPPDLAVPHRTGKVSFGANFAVSANSSGWLNRAVIRCSRSFCPGDSSQVNHAGKQPAHDRRRGPAGNKLPEG